jgi:two-component system, OmpR family, phosphate regulon response regulator PhoB
MQSGEIPPKGTRGIMERITILTTHPDGTRFEPFQHGEAIYSFEPLSAGGRRKLADGAIWAFIDWIVPELSGLELCLRLRADPATQHAHITMVLERDDIEDRRRALRAGADDYVVGPIGRQEILDRILAVQFGAAPRAPSQLIRAGELCIDLGAEQARWADRPIPLARSSFRVLRYLADNPNRVISRSELIEAVGKSGDPEYLRTVDVWIKRLRTGLRAVDAAHALRTIQGRGYVLDTK